ncbi:hypothetical protein [Amycolatopsis anabasis]|uniref:hypothetical protein n=1 Tax=Amycolatopsis anabasis TaxID=1840409 RepID=UPI00131BFE12|nr:hypothetical protein [Amycolatopsis anabasis]
MNWAEQMEKHSDTFRKVWAEEGFEYLMFKGGMAKEAGRPDMGAWNMPPQEDVQRKMQEIDTRIRNLFNDFASGTTSEANVIITNLSGANTDIRENFHEHLDGMDIYLEDWSGKASDNFREYVNQLKDALVRKQDCIDATRRSMDAYRQLHTSFKSNVLDLVESTQAALEQVEKDEEARSERMKLTIISAVVAVGAAALAVPTAGTSLGAAAAVAGVGSALVGAGTSAASIQVGGTHKGEVICNLVDEGDKITKEAAEAAGRVEAAFFKVTTFLTNISGDNLKQVRPDRPKIITDPKFDPEDFHPDNQPKEDRQNVRKDDLVNEPDRRPDEKRDHYLQDPKDREIEWDQDGLISIPRVKPPEYGRDAYDEQGPASDGSAARLFD